MALLDTLLIGAQSGQGSQGLQSSGQQSGSQPGLMSLLQKASKSGHSAVISGVMALVSAYRSRHKNRQRAMKQLAVGIALMAFGLWQIRRQRGKATQSSGKQSSGSRTASGQRSTR